MTQEEYYKILKLIWESVDKNNRQAIHDYNMLKEQLREQVIEND